MIATRLLITLVLIFTFLSACSKKQQQEEASDLQTLPLATQVDFERSVEMVSSDQLEPDERLKSIEADFNMDGLMDLAVVRKTGKNDNTIDILIRKPEEQGSESETGDSVVYFKAGSLTTSADCK
ncbi:MAG: hypothetical protein GX811_02900, partial [Lentisphaerae bacterium]|nr:hypothetical protein [Lentisphaerota bacterium]